MEKKIISGHNEDAEPDIKKYGYLLRVNNRHTNLTFTAYTYPGILSGNAWGFNNKGMVFSCNALFPETYLNGIPRNIITRDVYDSHNFKEAIHKLSANKKATGFSFNLGSIEEKKLANIEVAPESINVMPVNTNYSHFNNYLRLKIKQHFDISSAHRLTRANEFDIPTTKEDILTILGDRKDIKYPIYRTPTKEDCVETVSSVFYDYQNRTAYIYLGNPKYVKPFQTLTTDTVTLTVFF